MEENIVDKLKIEIDAEATEAIQKMTPLTEFTGRKILNALESIDETLKRIERFFATSFTRPTSRKN